MRRVNGYKSKILKSFALNKVLNLKMDTEDTENPFDTGVSVRGVDPDTENPFDTGAVNTGYDETGEINEMDRFPSSSSRRGSEDYRTYEETSFTTGGDISEITPLMSKAKDRQSAGENT